MKASEFRQIASVLGLFATVRETAEPPANLIGVQVSEGVAKLIAGQGPAGVVVTLDGEHPGKFAYTVSARPFLQASKVITGKQTVEIAVKPDGLHLTTSEGGKVFLGVEGHLSEAGFPKKPKSFTVESTVQAAQLNQLAKMFDAIHEDFEIEAPSMEQVGDVSHFVCVQPIKDKRAMYAHLAVKGVGPDSHASTHPVFWRSLKHMDADGLIRWGQDGALAVSGPYELYGLPYRVSPYDKATRRSEAPRFPEPWPIMALAGEPSVSLVADKKALIEVLKGVMPLDEHGRVTVSVSEGLINVAAFGTEGGMTIPAETLNEGHRACDAALLLKLLRAMDGKKVKIGWAQQPPMILSNDDMPGWVILLAPVALS
jgi:hypothetical protein